MKLLLIDQGDFDCYEGDFLERNIELRKQLASLDAESIAKKLGYVDFYKIIEIPDEITDCLIEQTEWDDNPGYGDYKYREQIYYVLAGKIHTEFVTLAEYKLDYDFEKDEGKYVEVKEVE